MTITERPGSPTSEQMHEAKAAEPDLVSVEQKRRLITRRFNVAVWQMVLVGVGVLVLGSAAGGAGGITQAELDNAEGQAVAARGDADTARAEAREDVASAEQRANEAEATARARVEAESAPKIAELDARAAALSATEADLAARERAVTGAEAAAKANRFDNGVHEVGVDIQPGKYKTSGGSGGTCYWEKTSKSGDIIDNDLLDGPTTVIIEASVFTFTSKDCGTWQRVG